MRLISAVLRVPVSMVAAAALLVAVPAAAADPVIAGAARATYDPFSGAAVAVALTVSVDLEGEATGILRIRPADNGPYALEGEGPSLAFILKSDAGSAAASGSLVIPVDSPRASMRFEVFVPAGQYAQAGLRAVSLEAQLFDAAGAPVSGPSRFIAEIDVAARAQANIAGASGVWGSQGSLAFIDFGELDSHETATAALQVRATTDVVITAWSDHLGRMIHVDHPQSAAEPGFSIAYRFSLDGVSSALTGPMILNRAPAPSLDGISYPILITLDDANGLYAGTYLDTLNIEVTAR
ncbi:hypothetical protein BZG35_01620 [Brevundimonas sp. LM2]|uniref:hypothetical protein n=1 Tax=Brevundimonas sp. LM2 TaxID=1938605 RepID=UPI000983CCC4|nr:hypothetical protein [Brevundimonas sp. LM2]AQR60497.1 hypothetical protein BZG35_01620 [Brevundimonas sp. LM2]